MGGGGGMQTVQCWAASRNVVDNHCFTQHNITIIYKFSKLLSREMLEIAHLFTCILNSIELNISFSSTHDPSAVPSPTTSWETLLYSSGPCEMSSVQISVNYSSIFYAIFVYF